MNERNKILTFASRAVEGGNIETQDEYLSSEEREVGVVTGIANGNGFNKLAKQVSLMCASLAEFIVNNVEDKTVSDKNTQEEISSMILESITNVISENSNIKIITAKSGITSINELLTPGIYYIFTNLSDIPYYHGISYGLLIVLDDGFKKYQLFSFFDGLTPMQVNTYFNIREYTTSFSEWKSNVPSISFKKNIVLIDPYSSSSSEELHLVAIQKDEEGNCVLEDIDEAMIKATLGIKNFSDYFNKITDKLNLQNQVEGLLDPNNGGTGQYNLLNIKNYLGLCSDTSIFPFYSGPEMTTSEWIDGLNGSALQRTSFDVLFSSSRLSDIPSGFMLAHIIYGADNLVSIGVFGVSETGEQYSFINGKWVKNLSISGPLPVANGGTGKDNLLNIQNAYNSTILTELKVNGQDSEALMDALPNPSQMFINYVTTAQIIDLPITRTNLTVVKPSESINQGYIIADSAIEGNIEQYICKFVFSSSSGYVAKWTKLRNSDGTTPTELINLPVGFIYIQLRGQSTPDQLFGSSGKWQDVSSTYAGEFFRAVGGNSASFGSKQNEGLPNIKGDSSTYRTSSGGSGLGYFFHIENERTGAFVYGNRVYTGMRIAERNDLNSISLGFDASKSNAIYGSSTHVTPYNSAVRIWKKIS